MFSYYPSQHSTGISLEDLFNASRYGCNSNDSYHRLQRQQQLRQQQLRDAYLRKLKAEQEQQEAYDAALKAERARRLAEAQAQQARQRQAAEDELVQVQLPDGRRYLVPASWVREQQAKAASQRRELSPTRIGEREESVLIDPTEPLAGSAQTEVFRVPISGPLTSVGPPPRHATPEEREEAAAKVPGFARCHLRLQHLRSIQDRFHAVRDEFATPSMGSLVFDAAAEKMEDSGVPRLAFGIPANRQVQEYEEKLLKFLMELDGVESSGLEEVKKARKGVVREVESELGRLDAVKAESWKLQGGKLAAQEPRSVEEEDNMKVDDQDGVIVPENVAPVETSLGVAEAPMEVDVPASEIAAPAPEVDAPVREADEIASEVAPVQDVSTSIQQTDAPIHEFDAPLQEADVPTHEVDIPNAEVEAPLLDSDASNHPAEDPTHNSDAASLDAFSGSIEPEEMFATADEDFATADEETWDILDDDAEDDVSDGQKTPIVLEEELGKVLLR